MIGDSIKAFREKRGLSQANLGDILNVSDKTVSSWENNRTEPNLALVQKLAEVLHCSVQELIEGDARYGTFHNVVALPNVNNDNVARTLDRADAIKQAGQLIAHITDDPALVSALSVYFTLTPEKKRWITETIRFVADQSSE